VRVGFYADLLYRREGEVITSHTAFARWIGALGECFPEFVVFGRVHPEPGRAEHRLEASSLEFTELPYYPSLRQPLEVLRALRRAARCFRAGARGCDAVVLFGPHPYAVVFGLIARASRVPVIVGVRQDFTEYLSNRTPQRLRPLARAGARLLEAAHRRLGRRGGAIVVGSEMAERYRRAGLRVIETGISLVTAADLVRSEELAARPWPGDHRILVAGRLDPEKNALLLADVAAALVDSPWRLVVAGTGSLADELAARLESRGLSPRVELLGRVGAGDLQTLYRECTVLLHVSLTEGQPQVLFEAAAAGMPIIATAVGGVPTALANGERGLLVPPSDVAAIERALERLDQDPAGRREMAKAAFEWVADETMERQVARISRFIEATG
jgi:glycosyltransferase involved in cell wall biosynthesis